MIDPTDPSPTGQSLAQLPDAAQQRIIANVGKLRQAGATDDQVTRYLTQGEGLQAPSPPPVKSAPAAPPMRIPGMAADDTRVAPGAGKAPNTAGPFSPAPWYQKGIEAVAGGLPGGRGVVALGTGLADLLLPKALGGTGFDAAVADANQSLKTQQRDVASLPAIARVPLELLGGSPLAALLGPMGASVAGSPAGSVLSKAGMAGGSAIFGGLQGADQPASSMGERGINTAFGTVTGGLLGALMHGAGNMLARGGVADAASDAAKTVLPKVGIDPGAVDAATSGIGTAGQVNKVMATRQGLFDDVGDFGKTAAKEQQDQLAAFKAQTDANYNLARQDATVLQDPVLKGLLQDKDVAPVMQKVSAIRNAGGNPIPIPSTNTILSPRDNGLLASDDLAAASAAFDQRYGRPGGSPTILPDPEAIHSLKRYLNDAAQRGLDSDLEITKDQARTLLPKAQAITDRLHALSPDWAAADQFHAQGMGAQEAYNMGFDAPKLIQNPTAENLATNSAEGMEQSITTPRYRGEPPEAIAARRAAFQRGLQANAGDAIRSSTVDSKMSDVLSNPIFDQTEKMAGLRRLMFDDPNQVNALEAKVANLKGTLQQSGASGGGMSNQPAVTKYALLRKVAKLGTKPDLLKTPQGASLVNLLSRDPAKLQQALQGAQGAGSVIPSLRQLLGVDVAGQTTGGAWDPNWTPGAP